MTVLTNTQARPDLTVGAGLPASRQVSWFRVYDFVARFAAGLEEGDLLYHGLLAGTVEWASLSDDDDHKLIAVLLGGVRDALRTDTHQVAMAEASREIASEVDCGALIRGVQRQEWRRTSGLYIARRSA